MYSQYIPLPSLLGRGWGWGFSLIVCPAYRSPPCGGGAGGGAFFIHFRPKSAGTSPHLRVSHFTR